MPMIPVEVSFAVKDVFCDELSSDPFAIGIEEKATLTR